MYASQDEVFFGKTQELDMWSQSTARLRYYFGGIETRGADGYHRCKFESLLLFPSILLYTLHCVVETSVHDSLVRLPDLPAEVKTMASRCLDVTAHE